VTLRLETKEGKMGIKMTGKIRGKLWCGWFHHILPSHPQSILFSSIMQPISHKANAICLEPVNPHFESLLASKNADIISKVPADCHDYLDVFGKIIATTLPLQQPYDHQINLEDGSSLPFSPIYSLSEVEQLTLKQFINKNLSSSLIHPSQSPAGAPSYSSRKRTAPWTTMDLIAS
jgi:hypothetical protein